MINSENLVALGLAVHLAGVGAVVFGYARAQHVKRPFAVPAPDQGMEALLGALAAKEEPQS